MKKIFLALAIAIFAAASVSAQDTNTTEKKQMTAQQRTEQRIKKMDEKMSLTDDQKTKIRQLYADFNKQKYPRDQRKAAMEKLVADITLVLTADQQTIYKQMQEQASAQRKAAKRNKTTTTNTSE